MQNLIKNLIQNLIHAYQTKNQAQFKELVEDVLNLPFEDYVSLHDYLEATNPLLFEVYTDVVREMGR